MKRKGNNIGWCDKTANPVTGCPNGCEYCYARKVNDRWKWVPDFSKPQFFPNRLKEFRTKEPMIIFIDSMSDIGYWQPEWIDRTCAAMCENPQNTYLALTKRYLMLSKLRLVCDAQYVYGVPDPVRFYIGATITNNAQAQAVIDAGGADFISFEPLLEQIKPELLTQLQCKWWIVGDLTKNGKPQCAANYMWVYGLIACARHFGTPLFMKDSMRGLVGNVFIQEFPQGWKEKR